MTASARILDHFSKANGSEPIRLLGASGQLGYGVPTPSFSAGLERKPHLIGCDMGSIDIGPYYLGSGELATALAATRRDLRKVMLGALKLKIPLINHHRLRWIGRRQAASRADSGDHSRDSSRRGAQLSHGRAARGH